jgi:hypothetical protein
MNCIMLGVVKTMELELYWNYSFAFCYFTGIAVSAVLCYACGYGLRGIWVGWLLALLIELYLNVKRVICFDVDDAFYKIVDRYKVVEADIRESKYQMTYEA